METICTIFFFIVIIYLLYHITKKNIKIDRLEIELDFAKGRAMHLQECLKYEIKYRNELSKELNDLKQSPFIVEKKAEVKIFNFEELVNGYHKYYNSEDLKRIYCDKFKVSLPDDCISYKAERIEHNNIKITAIVKILQNLE